MSSDPVPTDSSDPDAAPVPPSAAGQRDSGRPRTRGSRHCVGHGSWLLASAAQRMAAAALVSVALWAFTAWAMGWW